MPSPSQPRSSSASTSRRRDSGYVSSLRAEDYCFGKRIADDRGKTTANFRPGAKKGRDFSKPTADELGPGGSYNPPSSFNTAPSFNRYGTFGASSSKTLKKTQLNGDGVRPHENTEFTAPVYSSFASTWSSSGARAPSFGRPPPKSSAVRQTVVAKPSKGYGTEFTSEVPSSFTKASPSRARTPPPSRGSTSVRPSFRKPEERIGEFTSEVYSSFPKPNLIPRRSNTFTHKKTDTWLNVPKDDQTPGPGQYFVP